MPWFHFHHRYHHHLAIDHLNPFSHLIGHPHHQHHHPCDSKSFNHSHSSSVYFRIFCSLFLIWSTCYLVVVNSMVIVDVSLFTDLASKPIRPLTCSDAKGNKGTCMFSLACRQSKGKPIGICKDTIYAGSCCQLPGDQPKPFINGLINNVNSNTIVTKLPSQSTTTVQTPTSTPKTLVTNSTQPTSTSLPSSTKTVSTPEPTTTTTPKSTTSISSTVPTTISDETKSPTTPSTHQQSTNETLTTSSMSTDKSSVNTSTTTATTVTLTSTLPTTIITLSSTCRPSITSHQPEPPPTTLIKLDLSNSSLSSSTPSYSSSLSSSSSPPPSTSSTLPSTSTFPTLFDPSSQPSSPPTTLTETPSTQPTTSEETTINTETITTVISSSTSSSLLTETITETNLTPETTTSPSSSSPAISSSTPFPTSPTSPTPSTSPIFTETSGNTISLSTASSSITSTLPTIKTSSLPLSTSTTSPTELPETVDGLLNKIMAIQRPYNNKLDCGVSPLKSMARVVGGRNAHFGEWPWQVLIKEATWLGLWMKTKCGGVLIDHRWVLTAAHCQPGFWGSLLVVVGEYDLTGDVENLKPIQKPVKRMIVHRNYNPSTFENDIALMELESPFDVQPHVVPICLPEPGEEFVGQVAHVAGWGKLSYGGPIPSILQVVKLPILANDKCQEMYNNAGHDKEIKSTFLCAGYTDGGKDSCEGDSGGPLMVQRSNGHWVLVGTVSHGIKCAEPNLPGVYMKTAAYRSWIGNIINRAKGQYSNNTSTNQDKIKT